MYVVLTFAELTFHLGWLHGANGSGESSIEDWTGIKYQDLLRTGLPAEALNAYEFALPENVARAVGIIAPRGENWLGRFLNCKDLDTLPRAAPPDRDLPKLGNGFELQVCPAPKTRVCSPPKLHICPPPKPINAHFDDDMPF
jgi:hypothetical protein